MKAPWVVWERADDGESICYVTKASMRKILRFNKKNRGENMKENKRWNHREREGVFLKARWKITETDAN